MLAVDEMASVVGKSTNSNVTFSAVVFSTSYVSNVVNGTLSVAISGTVNASPVVVSAHGFVQNEKRKKSQVIVIDKNLFLCGCPLIE